MLTASQKDGVVRIWSWGSDTPKNASSSTEIDQIRQLYLRMVPPPGCHSSTTASALNRRKLVSSKPALQVYCDIATWTSDDSKVITSQCCLVTANGTEIVPGSQIVHVWDSMTGHCIISFPSMHEKPCSVLISHPLDPTIMASAGTDGYAYVWNLNTGEKIFSHENIHTYGSVEALTDRGKHCGYIDGSFSPDGASLVLTDDKGRVTIIDTYHSELDLKEASSHDDVLTIQDNEKQSRAPIWMQEQYFANDYYELFYDSNGYCIERGSRQPPHIAPEAARCNHTSSAYGDIVQDSLRKLPGPTPLCQDKVRNYRDLIRMKSYYIRKPGGILAQNVLGKRTLVEAYPTADACVIWNGSPPSTSQEISTTINQDSRGVDSIAPTNRRNETSSRYHYIDFDEATRDDDVENEFESDDEEYGIEGLVENDDGSNGSQSPRRRRIGSNSARARRFNRLQARREANNNIHTGRQIQESVQTEPSRTSARQAARMTRNAHTYEEDLDSDDPEFEEMLSTNKSPSGEYRKDFIELGHLFKIPYEAELNRDWLSRMSCIEGYTGWKTFAPQVGDDVVYIPRAHSDVLKAFPICNNSSNGAPWQSWPSGFFCPVVQCKVNNIRYRFPYEGYFGREAR